MCTEYRPDRVGIRRTSLKGILNFCDIDVAHGHLKFAQTLSAMSIVDYFLKNKLLVLILCAILVRG